MPPRVLLPLRLRAEGRDAGDTGVGHRLSEWGGVGSQAPGDGVGPSPRSPVQKQLRRLEAGRSQLDPDTKAGQRTKLATRILA